MQAIQQLIQQVLSEHGGEFVQTLVGRLGFDPSTAEQFVPAALSRIGATLAGGAGAGAGGLDLGALLQGGGVADLVSQIDVQGLASDVGTTEAQAREGLQTVAPEALSALREQAGGLDSLVSALGGGDLGSLLGAATGAEGSGGGLLGAVRKLGGLFGRS